MTDRERHHAALCAALDAAWQSRWPWLRWFAAWVWRRAPLPLGVAREGGEK